MSEIRVTTLKDTSGGNSSTTAQVFSGRAKAWVNFNGAGAVAIRANFNVNTITDNGTGQYAVNFSTAFADALYVPAGYSGEAPGSGPSYISASTHFASETFSTSSFTFGTGSAHASGITMANNDPTNVCIAFFR